jgi:hypothetical protein
MQGFSKCHLNLACIMYPLSCIFLLQAKACDP